MTAHLDVQLTIMRTALKTPGAGTIENTYTAPAAKSKRGSSSSYLLKHAAPNTWNRATACNRSTGIGGPSLACCILSCQIACDLVAALRHRTYIGITRNKKIGSGDTSCATTMLDFVRHPPAVRGGISYSRPKMCRKPSVAMPRTAPVRLPHRCVKLQGQERSSHVAQCHHQLHQPSSECHYINRESHHNKLLPAQRGAHSSSFISSTINRRVDQTQRK